MACTCGQLQRGIQLHWFSVNHGICSLVFPSLTQPIIGYLLKHRLEPGRLYSRSDEKGSMGLSSMALRGIQGSWTGDCVAGKGCSECQTWLRDCLRNPTKGNNF